MRTEVPGRILFVMKIVNGKLDELEDAISR